MVAYLSHIGFSETDYPDAAGNRHKTHDVYPSVQRSGRDDAALAVVVPCVFKQEREAQFELLLLSIIGKRQYK